MAKEIKGNFGERLLRSCIDVGFGVGLREKIVMVVLLKDKENILSGKKEREMYITELLREIMSDVELGKKIPEAQKFKWNPATLEIIVINLRDLGLVDIIQKGKHQKKYARISSLGERYLDLMKKTENLWSNYFESIKGSGRENEKISDIDGNDD